MNPATNSTSAIGSRIDVGDVPGNKTVIVFGDKGSGKSSTIRLLCNAYRGGHETEGNSNILISSSTCNDFSFERHDTQDFTFIETAGLSEGGHMSKYSKFCNLLKLIKYLQVGGAHLLVFVVRMGRISKTTEENYNIFVNGLCLSEVPVLIVVTHCENDSAVGNWWNINEEVFSKYGMTFNGAISACPVTPGDDMHPSFGRIMKELNDRSKVELPRAVSTLALNTGWKTDTWGNWLRAVNNSAWNLYWSAAIKNKANAKRRQSTVGYGSTGN